MRNSKKIIIPILVILILLLIAGGVFAYVYVATDLLKTDKEVFLKYFSQITAEDGFVDKRINAFNEKKKQMPYENNGEITAEVEYTEDSLNEIIEKVNDLSINILGKVDPINENVEQNIEIDYGDDVVLPINYRQDENKYGVQIDGLSKQYIAIRNENLEEFVGNIASQPMLNNSSNIANTEQKILGLVQTIAEVKDQAEQIEFTQEEQNQLKQIYGSVLEEQLLEEYFSSTKDGKNESFTLEITTEQITDIMIKMLEATKQNTLIIDKINELVLQQDENAETLEANDIDELIESLQPDDDAEIIKCKLTLVQSNKQLNQIIIEAEEGKLLISKNVTENNLSYNINYELKESTDLSDTNNEEESNLLQLVEEENPMQANLYFKIQYNGLEELSNVQENYEIGIAVTSEEQTMKYDYKINCNTVFTDAVSIEELDEDVAVFLNDYDESQVINFLTQVGTKLRDINKNQMNKLGLEEDENPLLYSNPITVLVMSFSNMASESVNGADLPQDETEIMLQR